MRGKENVVPLASKSVSHLKGEAEPQPDRSTVVDSLITKAPIEPTKIRIRIDTRDRQQPARSWVDI